MTALPTREIGLRHHDAHRADHGDDVVTHEVEHYDWGLGCQDCSWCIVTLDYDPGVEASA